jgi:DNA-binding transcriptional LysR family regulator
MSRAEPDWALYRTFLAAVGTGSLSGAARRIGSTQPTVGRQIEALEAALGVKLFLRSKRGLIPTQTALDLVPHARRMAAAAASIARAASAEAGEIAGTVRVTVGAQLGIEVLPAILADFARAHPSVDLELAISSQAEDLLQHEADIAIRTARPEQDPLIARRLGKLAIGLFAHKSYARAHGLPRSIPELSEHRLIGFDREKILPASFGELAGKLSQEHFAYRSDNMIAQVAMLRAGLGIGACHRSLARRDAELLPVLPGEVCFHREMWILVHPDQRKTRRIHLLFEHLSRGLKDYIGDTQPG